MLRRPSASPASARFWFAVPLAALLLVSPGGRAPAQGNAVAPASQPSPVVDPGAGMADIGLDWPDLTQDKPAPAQTPTAPESKIPATEVPAPPTQSAAATPTDAAATVTSESDNALLAALDPVAPLGYTLLLEGLGEAADEALMDRFNALSALRKGERESANIGQIRRRGRTDADLLDDLLRVRGYYDSRSRLDLRAGDRPGQVRVALIANPGQVYKLGNVDIDGLSTSDPREVEMRALFTVHVGDPADIDRINLATLALRTGLLDRGFPFSDVRDPVLVVDHERRTAALNMTVATGGFRRIGAITVNPTAPFDARHVQVISRFSPGDPFRQADLTDLDRAIVATGLVSKVTITPKPGVSDEVVDLNVTLDKAPPRTIAGELGYGSGEGARAEVSWQHRNLFPPEGALTVRGVLGTQEQSVSAILRRANFGARDRVLNGELSASNLDQPAYQAQSAGISASIERQTNIIFMKDWTWSLGTELRVSDERDLYGIDLIQRRRTYVIFALPTSLNYDGSDDLLDPRKGFRLGGRLSPEVSLQGSVFSYVRAQVDGSFYLKASDRLTIAGRGRLGTIVGASRDRIAPTRRFYAGGGASVRGYSYQAIGPRDLNNDPIGGRSLGELSLEARFRFGSANQFGLVPFIDAGTTSANPWPTLSEMRVGAGLGFRYYSNFGPIRIDVGTPLNPQPGDSRVGVYVSLGQAF